MAFLETLLFINGIFRGRVEYSEKTIDGIAVRDTKDSGTAKGNGVNMRAFGDRSASGVDILKRTIKIQHIRR